MRPGRLWLALVLAAFCFPLFIGLDRPDLETDEAIYSFAVDRILEIGDWLEPKSSPSETEVFLEKPPLKFWIVAAPIRFGLLPHDEFGLRFWDALFGGVAFLYVLAIGTLLAGPVCGAVAVLLLFVHVPLLLMHGVRTNNMEAPLLLSYCGGMYHVLRWARGGEFPERRGHALAAGLFFALGFMTKFVAALFLPLTLALAILGSRARRRQLAADWRLWGGVAAIVFALCAPWFVYAYARFGERLWDVILAEHVVRRLTNYLDPAHLQPWHFYVTVMWNAWSDGYVNWIALAGLVALLVQTVRRRWFDGAVILLWALVPLTIISGGTSKLYHYAFPFLPPIALAAGYLAALVVMLAPAPLRRVMERAEDRLASASPALRAAGQRPGVRRGVSILMLISVALAVGALALGQVRLDVGDTTLFRSSGIWRPLVVIVAGALAIRASARVSRVIVVLLVLNVLPLGAYRAQLERLPEGRHPIRAAAECLRRVQAGGNVEPGLVLDMPRGIWHPLYYYFRRVQPMTPVATPLDPVLRGYLTDPATPRPILMDEDTYRQLAMQGEMAAASSEQSPPMMSFLLPADNVLLLLPGPYRVCSSEALLHPTP